MINKYADLVKILRLNYAMINPIINELSGNSDETTLLVTDNKRKFILKIYSDPEKADLVVAVQNLLHHKDVRIQCPIVSVENKFIKAFGNKVLVLMTYIKGTSIGWSENSKKLKDELVQGIAEIVARMHIESLNAVSGGKLNTITFTAPTLNLSSYLLELDLSHLRKVFIHGDLTRDNIIVSSAYDTVVGIIDFSDASYNYLVYDLAVLLTQVFVTKTWGIDLHGIENFMTRYTNLNPLLPAEQKAIIPFMLYKNDKLVSENSITSDIKKVPNPVHASVVSSAKTKISIIHKNELELRRIFETL